MNLSARLSLGDSETKLESRCSTFLLLKVSIEVGYEKNIKRQTYLGVILSPTHLS